MKYRLIVTSVVYKETMVLYGTLVELTAKIEEFESVGRYTYQLESV